MFAVGYVVYVRFSYDLVFVTSLSNVEHMNTMCTVCNNSKVLRECKCKNVHRVCAFSFIRPIKSRPIKCRQIIYQSLRLIVAR